MSILVILICYILVLLCVSVNTVTMPDLKKSVLKSVLIFSTLVVIITEGCSIFYFLTYHGILIAWIVISLTSVVIIYSKRKFLSVFLNQMRQSIGKFLNQLGTVEILILSMVAVILLMLFIQGMIYPPNNYDSMTYHLPRILSWISNRSVVHFPTHIVRQLYSPPFTEFLILNSIVLSGNDYFANTVQFFYLVFTLIGIAVLVKMFHLSRKYVIISWGVVLTLPVVLLQATNTKNDIVCAFFVISTIIYAIESVRSNHLTNYIYLGLSIGLCLLTKSSAYIYLTPILCILSIFVLIKVIKFKKLRLVIFSIVAVFIALSLNVGFFYRNIQLSNNFLGADRAQKKMVSNEKMNPPLLLSVIIKNIGLHIGPFPINYKAIKIIKKLHVVIGVDINDPAINFTRIQNVLSPDVPNHEDNASNSIHFYLICIAILLIGVKFLKNKKSFRIIFLYQTMLVIQGLLFCLYLKWQPWHTRLHIPLFLLSIPLIAYAVSISKFYCKLFILLLPIMMLSGFLVVLFNHSRPYINSRYTSTITMNDTRYKKYFADRPEKFEDYNSIMNYLKGIKGTTIGLILNVDDYEYPLFSNFYYKDYHIAHINVANYSQIIPNRSLNIDYIISTVSNNKSINYQGDNYYNQNRNNKIIWLYRKF